MPSTDALLDGKVDRPVPLTQTVYATLRDLIRRGDFEPGTRLAESVIARRMDVSRSPVREALWRLVSDGLIEGSGHGFRLPEVTPESVAEITDLRRLLEPTGAARAARAMTDAAVARLDTALASAHRAHASDDLPGFLEANYAFRAAWLDQLGNARLRETLMRFDDQAGLVRRVTFVRPEARDEGLALMAAGRDAFATGAVEAAEQFARAYIDGAERHFHAHRPANTTK